MESNVGALAWQVHLNCYSMDGVVLDKLSCWGCKNGLWAEVGLSCGVVVVGVLSILHGWLRADLGMVVLEGGIVVWRSVVS